MSRKEIILGKIKEVVNHTVPESEIFLYGSRARGNARKQSDWDILILLATPKVNFELEKQFIDALYEIEIETGEVISPLVYSKTEWIQKHSFTPLFENINRDGIRI
ncbi:MAG: nucleotidyltransferase domain-containing protein [Bacteroidota bacterium]|nr:nucleotidyltransferase domain-containing protein [Odoribacter sp.]MDP3643557.1 nucleotidyltransferase domain-containing protein [Bacteroidota bacterium]